jgi:hypothetical protein
VSRIDLKSGITQNVKTSDLERVGQGTAEGNLEEVDRRGFLKGMSAAAGLTTLGISKDVMAQSRLSDDDINLLSSALDAIYICSLPPAWKTNQDHCDELKKSLRNWWGKTNLGRNGYSLNDLYGSTKQKMDSWIQKYQTGDKSSREYINTLNNPQTKLNLIHSLNTSNPFESVEQGVAEAEKIGNMDADRFDDAMARLKKLAGAGPLKTVYDPAKRVYRNVPTAVQPPTQPKK